SHSCEWWAIAELIRITIPTINVIAPAQSHNDQLCRHLRIRADRQPTTASTTTNAPISATSSDRTATATIVITSAAANLFAVGRSATRTRSQRVVVEARYANGSSAMIGE